MLYLVSVVVRRVLDRARGAFVGAVCAAQFGMPDPALGLAALRRQVMAVGVQRSILRQVRVVRQVPRCSRGAVVVDVVGHVAAIHLVSR